MPNKYNPKIHHRQSIRLKNYDYASDGYYFVTICTENKTEYFGEIINSKMILNKCGEIAKKQWLWLAEQYDYVKLDEWIVMLNHLHGILIIENGIKNIGTDRVVGTDTKNQTVIRINRRVQNHIIKINSSKRFIRISMATKLLRPHYPQ